MTKLSYEPYRQKYKDVPIEEALSSNCDLFQIKHDGIWARIVINNDMVDIYSRTGRLKKTFSIPPTFSNAVLVGEYMFGSERAQTHPDKDKLIVFDCTYADTVGVSDRPYIERYKMALVVLNNLTERFKISRCFKVRDAERAWELLKGKEEGLVFRHSQAQYDDTILRAKYEVTFDYYVVGFKEGEGRLTGSLGALVVSDRMNGPELMRVGGGFTDDQRRDIWHNQAWYINACVSVTGKGAFSSGKLRHPNFLRWRKDK